MFLITKFSILFCWENKNCPFHITCYHHWHITSRTGNEHTKKRTAGKSKLSPEIDWCWLILGIFSLFSSGAVRVHVFLPTQGSAPSLPREKPRGRLWLPPFLRISCCDGTAATRGPGGGEPDRVRQPCVRGFLHF